MVTAQQFQIMFLRIPLEHHPHLCLSSYFITAQSNARPCAVTEEVRAERGTRRVTQLDPGRAGVQTCAVTLPQI